LNGKITYDRDNLHFRVGSTLEVHMMGATAAVRCTVPFFTVELLDDLWRLFNNERFRGSACIWLGCAGQYGVFQSGGHLMHMVENRSERALASYGEKCIRLVKSLLHHPMPTTAVVTAGCFGGGLESALCCRNMVATPDASLQFPEYHFKAFPGMGGRLFGNELTVQCLDTLNEGGLVRGPLALHRPLPLALVGGIMKEGDPPIIGDRAVKTLVNQALDGEVAAWVVRMGRLLADPVELRTIEARAELQARLVSRGA
jgi:hypothetical protein